MSDFRKIISPQSQAEIVARTADLLAFQAKSPAGMAAELLDCVRALRASGTLKDDPRYSYDEWGVYRVAPSLARQLDPTVELLPQEIASDSEQDDLVTWIASGDSEKLRSCVQSILSNASYQRCLANRRSEAERIADKTFGQPYSMFSIAADTAFPGLAPRRAEVDERPPLEGVYVIEEFDSGFHRVLAYSEDTDEIDRTYETAVAMLTGAEVPEENLEIKNYLARSRFTGTVLAISVQAFDGEELRAYRAKPAADAECETPEP